MTGTTKELKAARKNKAKELVTGLEGLNWLGKIVMWNSGPDGTTHRQSDVTAALVKAGLDPKVSRELLPRHAFARASRKLSDERVIDVFAENETHISFQFTRKFLNSTEWEFKKECFVQLNKITGDVTADDTELAKLAQEEVDRATEMRTTADISRIVQRCFEEKSELIPMRDAGGVYFVPKEHATFIPQIELFLNELKGTITSVPIPAGTADGNKAIQNAVGDCMKKLIDDHMLAVKSFEVNTRKDTIARAAEKITETRVKIEAYAHYLGERQRDLLKKITEANVLLTEQVEAIGGGKKAYTEYDWDVILDGKVHKLIQGEDFLGEAVSVLARARVHAKRKGLKVRTSVKNDGAEVILQAVKVEA